MNKAAIHLSLVDYSILGLYIVFVIGIGFALKRHMKTSADFFLSGRSIPAWVRSNSSAWPQVVPNTV